jgi:DNA-binding SARP family transcriptional activator
VDPATRRRSTVVRPLADPVLGARLVLLGRFELAVAGGAVQLPPAVERVVAFVALHQRCACRAQVAGSLWSDTTDERAMGSLRSALWRLRQAAGAILPSAGDELRLAQGVAVDVRDLSKAAWDVLDSTEAIARSDADGLETSGELLPDWSDEWVLVERERFRQLRLHALEQLSDRYVAAGAFGRAVEAALSAVALEPFRESAQRALVRVHLAEGNVREALHQYRAYERLLREELGLTPSDEMTRLVQRVLEQRPPMQARRRPE